MSISTGPVIPMILQSYKHYVIDDSIQGSTDHIINLNTIETSRALMEGINMEKSSQGCYKAMQLSQ